MGNSEKKSLENRIDFEIIVRREAQLEVQEAFRYYQGKKRRFGVRIYAFCGRCIAIS